MNAKILVIEDDFDIADIIMRYLKKDGVETVWKETGEEGLISFERDSFDLIVLDINLPGIDGIETLNKIRLKSHIPVIIVSARQEEADMIMGFGTGADDYVTKPFSPSVLVARIRAHLRKRDYTPENRGRVVGFGDFTLDTDRKILQQNKATINLSPREMDLLTFLVNNPGKTYSQEELYNEIWGSGFGDLNTVTVHIRRLRKKLQEESPHYRYIRTSYGQGYYFEGDKS